MSPRGLIAAVVVSTVAAATTALPFHPYPLWSATVSPAAAAGPPLVVGDTVYAVPRTPYEVRSRTGSLFGAVAIDKASGAQRFKVVANFSQSGAERDLRGSIGVTSGAGGQRVLALGFTGTDAVFGYDAGNGAALWTAPMRGGEVVRNIAAAAGVVVVQTPAHMLGLDAATGRRKWGPVPLPHEATLTSNLQVHADRLVITCIGGTVLAYQAATGGLLWSTGAPASSYIRGYVTVANGLVTVNGIWLPTYNAMTVVMDANSGYTYANGTSGCGTRGTYPAVSNGQFSIVTPPRDLTCPLAIFNVNKPTQAVSLPGLTEAIGGIMVGSTAVVSLQKNFGAVQLTGIDAATGAVQWSIGSALNVYQPVLEDGVLYGSAYTTTTPGQAGSVIAVRVAPPSAAKKKKSG